MSTEAKPKSHVLRWLGCFLLVCGALFGLALVGTWMLRNVMLTQVLDGELRARSVTCDALSISSTSLMGEITLAPTSCAIAEPTISRVRWRDRSPSRAQACRSRAFKPRISKSRAQHAQPMHALRPWAVWAARCRAQSKSARC